MTPIHDWSRVDPGLFHHFHQRWTIALSDAFNAGGLPDGYYALIEQRTGLVEPDILSLHLPATGHGNGQDSGGVAVATAPPRTRFVMQTDETAYSLKANRIVVYHPLGEIVAVVEIVSPGNKRSRVALRDFVEKAAAYVNKGVHLLVIDLFPPTSRDPQGIHPAIWNELHEEPFELPADKRLTLAAYAAGPLKTAYVEPVAVGDVLPSMPLFLAGERYVPAPLAETYEASWITCPKPLQDAVLGGGSSP